MMDLPPQSLAQHDAPAIEWLHVMPPADSADLVLGYEAAYPFLQVSGPATTASALGDLSGDLPTR